MGGLHAAFEKADIVALDAAALGLDAERIGAKGSATKILNVSSPTEGKENIVLTGTPKRIVEQIFERFGDRIGGAIGRDLQSDKKSS
jgi:electron transfer flavoprotein beta subunit